MATTQRIRSTAAAAASDILIGRGGADTLIGGAAADEFRYLAASDVIAGETVSGGGGIDTLRFSHTGDLDFAPVAVTSIERILFANTFASARVDFAASQFGGAGISDAVEIVGTSEQNLVDVNLAATISGGATFSAAGWTFAAGWGLGGDTLNFFGSTGADTITGSAQADRITGGNGRDDIDGGAGNDILFFDSDDGVFGETLNGGIGIDAIVLTSSNATTDLPVTIDVEELDFNIQNNITAAVSGVRIGGAGDITIIRGVSSFVQSLVVNAFGNADLSAVSFIGWGGAGQTITINGNLLADTLVGSSQRDTINGGGGNDFLNGGASADTMLGGAGDDRYILDSGGDVVVESAGEGVDSIVAFLDHTIEDNVENMVLQGGNIATGNAGNNCIDGHGGGNTLSGRGGNDQLFGHGGNDTLEGGDNADILDGGSDADTMAGGPGDDRYVVHDVGDVVKENAGEGLDTVQAFLSHTLAANVENLILERGTTATGNAENNRIDGHGGNSTLSGLSGNDQIFGYGGDDTLDGGLNADTMRGGSDNDRYILDNGGDTVIENAGEGLDTAFLDHTIEANVENMNMESGVFGTGNAENNRIDGNGAGNILNGRGGKDLLLGHSGNDTLEGGSDDDTFVFTNGTGSDTIIDMQGGVSRGDVIDIRAFGFADFEAVMAATTDQGGGALIRLDADDRLFVQNMTRAQFDSNDFLLA